PGTSAVGSQVRRKPGGASMAEYGGAPPRAKTRPPETSTARCPRRSAMRPATMATGITTSGPGVIARPAWKSVYAHLCVRKKTKLKNMAVNAMANANVAMFARRYVGFENRLRSTAGDAAVRDRRTKHTNSKAPPAKLARVRGPESPQPAPSTMASANSATLAMSRTMPSASGSLARRFVARLEEQALAADHRGDADRDVDVE